MGIGGNQRAEASLQSELQAVAPVFPGGTTHFILCHTAPGLPAQAGREGESVHQPVLTRLREGI